MVQANVDIEQSLGAYLNKADRFATRMAASMHKSVGRAGDHHDQKDLFVQDAQVNLMRQSKAFL